MGQVHTKAIRELEECRARSRCSLDAHPFTASPRERHQSPITNHQAPSTKHPPLAS
jgi:hypothetical protein